MSTRTQRRKIVKSLHQRRRDAGLCIYDNRDKPGGKEHGTPMKGGRCADCWQRKLDSQAAVKAKAKAANDDTEAHAA